ncbi:MAG: mechanosensitive ion channel domain-containing protein [Pseudomonadota bacterium]
MTRIMMILGLLFFQAPLAGAQIVQPDTGTPTEVTLPDPITPEAVREMVSRLSDQDVRQMLLQRLDAVAEEAQSEAADGPTLVESVQFIAGETVSSLGVAVARSPEIMSGISGALARFYEPRGVSGVLFLIGATVLAILIGLAAEWIIDRIARRWRERIANEQPEGLKETLGLLTRRAILDIGGLIAFYIISRQVLLLILSDQAPETADGVRSFPDTLVATTFIATVVMYPRGIRALIRFLSAPYSPALRLVHTDDWTAQFLHRQQTIVFALWGLIAFLVPFLASHGMPAGEIRLGFWLNLVAFGIMIDAVWRTRPGLSMMLLGKDGDVTRSEHRVAMAYPYLCLIVIFLAWIVVEALVSQGLFGLISSAVVTMIILLFTPTFDMIVRGLVKHLVPPMSGEGPLAEKAYHSTKRSYIRIGRVLIAVAVMLFITELWGLDLHNLAASGVGAQFAGRMVEILFILLSGYLVWEVVSLWINRKLAAEQTAAGVDLTEEEVGGEGGGAGGSRLSTVLPLVLGVLKVAIAVIFGLIALGNIGIDITPLLAGAGIVGLAIGFGAQKLVADVVSGIFFLVDDAFRTGEFVEVEGTVGTVEKISIRSMQLRHHKGPVHTIPYGEIPKLTNYSRDWVIMKLKFTVPFETDPNKVKKLFKQIGKDMMQVPEYAADLLQPFKSQGVFDFDDVGMIIRGKFMAKPGRQFVLRKEIYNRVKKTFEENGIQFARREVRVAIPGLDSADLSDEQRDVVAEAAAQVAQDSIDAAAPPDQKT